tara:strand:+ start:249 stop:788 length:540 start_codon:yes stop_codon:yes gene_type:complete
MRAFIMIELKQNVKDYLFDIRKKFSSKDAKISWVHKKNIHQTLKFLGDVDDEKIEEVREKLREVKFKPFDVGLSEVGYFPTIRNIRVLWVGLDPVNKIIELQQDVEGKLRDLFKVDSLFKPHITLGRVKNVKHKKNFLKILEELEVDKLRFRVKNFKLVKSVLTKDGPRYTVIEEYDGV